MQVLGELAGDLGIGGRSAVAVGRVASGADLSGDALRLGEIGFCVFLRKCRGGGRRC